MGDHYCLSVEIPKSKYYTEDHFKLCVFAKLNGCVVKCLGVFFYVASEHNYTSIENPSSVNVINKLKPSMESHSHNVVNHTLHIMQKTWLPPPSLHVIYVLVFFFYLPPGLGVVYTGPVGVPISIAHFSCLLESVHLGDLSAHLPL